MEYDDLPFSQVTAYHATARKAEASAADSLKRAKSSQDRRRYEDDLATAQDMRRKLEGRLARGE